MLKVSMFREYCNGVVIKELNVGHWPHDEQPDEVNFILCGWIKIVETASSQECCRGYGSIKTLALRPFAAIVARFWYMPWSSLLAYSIPKNASSPFSKPLSSGKTCIRQDCMAWLQNMERVDDWLIDEMIRASCDPGVLLVLESIFNFNLVIPLNYLLQSFGGKVIIVQV
ncbi:hypothetical protein NE237_029805 [Protea cynaroides]|uniref:Uncharacterized protein n=1 Tax=Protea cynaroides TaxID=273540 RepID=A0A9Q0GUL1_9MAGN|nr:hypothetical protein NE237_029805 [Protea cynaroides]